jgi:Spy/CpxP family protein refolding chaperone
MRRNRKALLSLAVLGMMLLPAAGALAQPGPDPRGAGDRFARLCERLDLSDEQQAAVAKLREEGRAERRAWRAELIRLRHDLRGEMLQEGPSAARIDKLSEDIGALQAKVRASRLKQRVAMRNLLTPEQRDRLPLPGERPGMRQGRGHSPRGDCPADGEPRQMRQGHRPGRGHGLRGLD